MEPTLNNLLQSSLRWFFVGGKGGVGKTTTSCSLATLFASTPVRDSNALGGSRPRKVLLVSTDPAHNLSDAFDQKIGSVPTPIVGLEEQLFAMEIDPANFLSGSFFAFASGSQATSSPFAALGEVLKSAAGQMPGIDEFCALVEILKSVQQLSYDTVLFDTAPTGHTLRMLALPKSIGDTLDKVSSVGGLAPLVNMATSLLGHGISFSLEDTLKSWKDLVLEVQQQFTDETKTSFVCVCIPEFLSVYETERLVQELMKYNIACENVVVNQVVMKKTSDPPCRFCTSRQKIQEKYLIQLEELYEDFHIIKMPMLMDEVRGVKALQYFSRFLLEPYDPDEHGYLNAESTC